MFKISGVSLFLFVLAVIGLVSCSSSDSSITDVTDAFPDNLAISSPTEGGIPAAASLFKTGTFEQVTGEFNTLLTPEDVTDCTFDIALTMNYPSPACYGPSLYYNNHPDADGEENPPPNGESPQLPPFDLGIWNTTADPTIDNDEVCVAATLNHVVEEVADYANLSLTATASMLCVASVNAIELPGTNGDAIDLTDELDAAAVPGVTVTEATLTRLEDTADGYAVYESHIVAELTTTDDDVLPVEFILKHAERATASYLGQASFLFRYDEANGMPECEMVDKTGMVNAGYVVYDQSSSTDLSYELYFAQFCGSDAEPFDANNKIVATDTITESNTDGWAHNYNKMGAEFNPEDGSGNYYAAWVAGAPDGSSRVLNVTMNEGGETGCGYYGYGPDAYEDGLGTITKFYPNWAGPGGNSPWENEGEDGRSTLSKAQKQCMALNADTGYFELSGNEYITYAPTNTGDVDQIEGDEFTYSTGASSTEDGGMTNDNPLGEDVINNLIDLTEITDFTLPTSPSEL